MPKRKTRAGNAAMSLYSNDDRKRIGQSNDHAMDRFPRRVLLQEFRQDTDNLIRSSFFRRLEGKTQLFPEAESDLFRDRLTHSIEVSELARNITVQLNKKSFFKESIRAENDMQIDYDLVEFAGLAHDLGHPPFGHTGEHALDECMAPYGGFEGNAQTLRIICRLIRRQYPDNVTDTLGLISDRGEDRRIGLNATFRSIASIIKYDNVILDVRSAKSKLQKGFYWAESEIVELTKRHVLGNYYNDFIERGKPFRTIECWIMDVADDIAYSTSDLEDAFTSDQIDAGDFLYPKENVIRQICSNINNKTKTILSYPGSSGRQSISETIVEKHLRSFAILICNFVNRGSSPQIQDTSQIRPAQEKQIYKASERLRTDMFLRRQFLDWWIDDLINKVRFRPNKDCPPLTRVFLEKETAERVDVLKNFVFETITLSAPLQTMSFKGETIVNKLFEVLDKYFDRLLPHYEKNLASSLKDVDGKGMDIGQVRLRYRIISDYIAGMTDHFASALFDQLLSGNATKTVNHQLFY